MRIGILTGSGTYALPGFQAARSAPVGTPYGEVEVSEGAWAGVEVVHIARHGAGHARLSNTVNHRANIWALRERGATCVIGLTACGAVDPDLELGSLIVFDDLWFLGNRLPDGSLCTFFDQVGDPRRGHWVLHRGPFSEALVDLLTAAALDADLVFQGGGIYGHVDGPRFNTPVEIAQLSAGGVSAVSQTGGPETVLCGELELPFALVGFVTDYANEVVPGEPTPVATLSGLIARSTEVFAALLREALPRIAAADPPPGAAGTMLRIAPADAPVGAPAEREA
ncbi:MAG TPA: MTAP family purine nucleoside phosphorylase [Solirubrobacteraceae bacterium]|nr:MTAP family purine nucleoside phosphorylase [Solirubrobacteraceae bacterium]